MKDFRERNIVDLSRDILEYIIDFLPDAMFAIDKEGRVIKWNRAVEEMTGVKASEILGKGDYEVAVPFYGYKRPVLAHYAMQIGDGDIEKNYSSVKREGNVLIAEVYVPFPGYRKEGAWLWGRAAPLYDADGMIIGAVEVVRDISERKRLEEERIALERNILEAEKRKTIEILAAGVAHDFNNILMAILGYTDLILNTSGSEIIKRYVEEIKKIVIRGSDLSRQMLRFAGRVDAVFEYINPSRIVGEMLDLLRAAISKKIDVEFHSYCDEIYVFGDPTQLRQVILNLVMNAAEAIGDRPGLITINLDSVYLDRSLIKDFGSEFDLQEGDYIRIEVVDNGCGMDEEVIKHIFEPFFTTKFAGRGLGMAEVMGIVKAHKGAIRVASIKGEGSRFEIFLPVSKKEVDHNQEGQNIQKYVNGYHRFSGSVLLVDDEEAVRFSIGSMLKRLGFEVSVGRDGEDALRLYLSSIERPDLVILDILMPFKDGIEVLREIRRIEPSQKVLLISGFTDDRISLKDLNEDITAFLRKPFDIDELRKAISRLFGYKEG